jgi:hypothetical protein
LYFGVVRNPLQINDLQRIRFLCPFQVSAKDACICAVFVMLVLSRGICGAEDISAEP